jgi:probable DNA metabolism protein
VRRVLVEPDFDAWRSAAREALAQGFRPEEIDLQDASAAQNLTLVLESEHGTAQPFPSPHVPKPFVQAAEVASVHRDPERWNLLYRLLYRLQTERGLMHVEVDNDVAELHRLRSQVQRDLHKMHAFVRFRKVEDAGTDHFIAWYRPDHRILRLAAPFFQERFSVMQWTILTPDESVSWDPVSTTLEFGPGAGKEAAPQEDELEDMWRGYYGAIFNPARLNPEAMRSEMPVRYWQNLPEVDMLPQLMQKAERRVNEMVIKQKQQPTAAPYVPAAHTLQVLRNAMPACQGCDLYRHATQVVPGLGAKGARLMLVGEQPGDQEDLQGEPFVGPAGKLLRKAMDELRIDADKLFVTNAVKHFKFVQRGKLRLHQNPRMSEISACRPWLEAELEAVKPRVVLCLGASAAKSLLGGTFTLMNSRGQVHATRYAERVYATVHPSAVLRARDEAGRQQLYHFLKKDLSTAYQASLEG